MLVVVGSFIYSVSHNKILKKGRKKKDLKTVSSRCVLHHLHTVVCGSKSPLIVIVLHVTLFFFLFCLLPYDLPSLSIPFLVLSCWLALISLIALIRCNYFVTPLHPIKFPSRFCPFSLCPYSAPTVNIPS